jgi:hypothetical protein
MPGYGASERISRARPCNFVNLQRFEPRVVAHGQQFQVMIDDRHAPPLRMLQTAQLQAQAFGRVARAGGSKLCSSVSIACTSSTSNSSSSAVPPDFLERCAQVAVVVERFDQEDGQALVAWRSSAA